MSAQLVRRAITFVFTALSLLVAQAQSLPPRDAPPLRQPAGTARVQGRIVDAHTGSVLPRARVRLLGPGGERLPMLSDANGQFEFAELPAGSFSVNVERSGYIQSRYPELGRSVRANSRALTLAEGQILRDIVVPLYHGGVITGRVIDRYGEPVENALVRVQSRRRSGRGPEMLSAASTNDLGEFRIPRLQAGAYFVLAVIRSRDDDPAEALPLPTYYPGVASIDQAQPVTVERGQTVSAIDVVLLDAAANWVSGMVVDASGQPVDSGGISIRHVSVDSGPGDAFTQVRRDGTFRTRLPPGDYELEAFSSRPGVSGPRSDDQLFGVAYVSLSGEPVTGVTIRVGRHTTISGRLVFEGESALPSNPQQIPLFLVGRSGVRCRRGGRAEIASDWTFRIVDPMGTCSFSVGTSGPWIPKAVLRNGEDLIDAAVTLMAGQSMRDVQVVFTDRRTEMKLQVADDHGLSTRDYVAVAFAVDRTKWVEGSRFVRLYVPPTQPPRAAAAREFRGGIGPPPGERPDALRALPEGEYYVAAVDDLPADGWYEPATLDALTRDAVRVRIREGDSVDVSLRRTRYRAAQR